MFVSWRACAWLRIFRSTSINTAMMMLALTRTIPITEKRALLVPSDNLATDLNLPSTVVSSFRPAMVRSLRAMRARRRSCIGISTALVRRLQSKRSNAALLE